MSTPDHTSLRGAPWREYNDPADRLIYLPKLPANYGRGSRRLVAQWLRDAIGLRMFRQGEAMPTPLAMANHFGCAPDTCRSAMQQLAAEGWLRHVPRMGMFVRGANGQLRA